MSALIRGQACLGRNAAEYFDASSLNLWSCHLSTTVLLGYEFKALTPLYHVRYPAVIPYDRSRSSPFTVCPSAEWWGCTGCVRTSCRWSQHPPITVLKAMTTFAKCAKTRSKVLTLLDPADRSSSGSATSCRFKYSEPLLLCIKPFLDSLHGGEEYLTVGMVVDSPLV